MKSFLFTGAVVWLGFASLAASAVADDADLARVKSAQAFRARGEAVTPAPDGTYFCEAEEFKIIAAGRDVPAGWRAGYWGENYYAATFANTFLSRKAFLGAPEDCGTTEASITVDIRDAGKYLVLVRYEAAYRFETQFRVKITQGRSTKLDRLYGARANTKVWAFGKRLATEVAWEWGAVENVVWEGHDAYADLVPGIATITLVAGKQPAPAAKRNVDLVMLTRDDAQVQKRIASEGYLPLDGWLTQDGDVWMRVINGGGAKVTVRSLTFYGGPMQQHSPYWVHMRNWKPVAIEVAPGATVDWINVGGTMDSLNDGQWGFSSTGPCQLEFGVKNAKGAIESIRKIACSGQLPLVSCADARYSRTIVTPGEADQALFDYLKRLHVPAKSVSKTVVYGVGGMSKTFYDFFGLNGAHVPQPTGYTDLRNNGPAQLEAACLKLSPAERNNMFVVSLGDEIGLPTPAGAAATEGFVAFLKSQGVKHKEVDPDAGDWSKLVYNPNEDIKKSKPGLYYWSCRYLHHYGIVAQKTLTDALRKHLPNAHIGANFSPHHGGGELTQLGEAYKWIDCFRKDGMTLPWAEDYIWQVPVGSPQMNSINLDLFRAGNRGKPGRKIMYYVMPHYPGNTPAMWRRLLHNAVGHGATILNLFEFDPVWVAYSENHVTSYDMYAAVLRALRELALYEDIIQTGAVRQAPAAMWFSETADIWRDNMPSFGAAKRALYVAILGRQIPLDFIIDQDAADGTLDSYRLLYLTDNHVSRASSEKISAWVKRGGRLFATAGAGMFDEYDQPNKVMRELMGVDQTGLIMPAGEQVSFIKQDLPFVKPIDEATLGNPALKMPLFGIVSKVKAASGTQVSGTLSDGSPAVIMNTPGKGKTLYSAFLPGLTYFKPAIPCKPLDRGSTDDAMAHLIPTEFDKGAGEMIGLLASDSEITLPVVASSRLVETSIIESKAGTALVVANWSGTPVASIDLTIAIPVPQHDVSLASGGKILVKTDGKTTRVRFDLDIADVVIFR